MGGIKCVTPSNAVCDDKPIPRKDFIPAGNLVAFGFNKVTFYKPPSQPGYTKLMCQDISNILIKPDSAEVAYRLDSLWMSGTCLNVLPRANWNGFMERATTNKSFEMSAIIPLPFINLDPSNCSTIYSSLLQASKEGISNGQSHVIVTFDQPLFAKATDMVLAAGPDSPLTHVIVRLCGFHLLLSFMGTIGHIMNGSGIEYLWETVYAKNSVPHILNGKAYSRAVRAHLLTQNALGSLLLNEILQDENLREGLRNSYTSLLSNLSDVQTVVDSEPVVTLASLLHNKTEEIKITCGRTGKLWIQYMNMVEILRMFIRAERCGDWELHLYSVQQMLPYLHSAGHVNYAKSAHIYLQMMLQLSN